MKTFLWRAAKIALEIIIISGVALSGFFVWYDHETRKCLDKRGDEVIAACTEYLKSDWAPEVLLHRGRAYQSKGHHDLAIADLNKYLEIVPRDKHALALRAFSYEKTQRLDEAIADWSKIISMFPKHAHSYLSCGNAFAGMRKIDQARPDWETVLTLADVDGLHEAARQNLSKFK